MHGLPFPLRLLAVAALIAPLGALADPPAHAPAHGYRAKQRAEPVHRAPAPANGIEVVFDSARGIHVAVGLPGIFFHEGHYYRQHEGHWQMSATGRGGWQISASSGVPEVVVKAKARGPGPAKARGRKRSR